MHRVVVVGGGFAGVRCVQHLRKAPVDVTLIDRRNFHLFQPLLYQVATGGLSPGDIAAPIRSVLKRCKNTRVVLGEVVDVELADGAGEKAVVLEDGVRVPFDSLVIATGARHSYFGHDEWEPYAPGLKSIEDATEIRARVLAAFERAELEDDAEARAAWLTFVIVGGGPTGVELAGALGELARQTMRGEFRRIEPNRARILVVEGAPRLLGMYSDRLAAYGKKQLEDLGVEVKVAAKVVGVDDEGVDIESGGGKERIRAHTVVWAAGVAGSKLGRILHERAGAPLDRAGRVVVEPDCTVAGHPDIFVLGDLANWAHPAGSAPLPGVAPVAMQMGSYAAEAIRERLRGRPVEAFRFFDKGTMAVIGRNKAVARLGFGLGWQLRGFVAWLTWLFVHIMYLVDYENRVLVAIQWANYYVTRHRGARLITSADRGPLSLSAPPRTLATPSTDGKVPSALPDTRTAHTEN